jgi:hypothetical protein
VEQREKMEGPQVAVHEEKLATALLTLMQEVKRVQRVETELGVDLRVVESRQRKFVSGDEGISCLVRAKL